MSNKYYEEQWSEAINEFLDVYQLEFQPWTQLQAEKGKKTAIKKPADWFQFYANVYLNYIQIYKKLEECYDQIIHPQKRRNLKLMLDNSMLRILELKNDLIMFNVDTKALNSDFVNLDELLYSLKILPDRFEIPIPKYFREETGDNFFLKRDQLVSSLLEKEDRHLPEEEAIEVRNPMELNETTVIWNILVNERGRQGIVRGQDKKQEMIAEWNKNKKKKGGNDNEKAEIHEACIMVQKYYRAYCDREKIAKMREEEAEFLGITIGKDVNNATLDKQVEKIKESRKGKQAFNANEMKDEVTKVKESIFKHESPDIKENLLYQMRNWITEYYEAKEGKDLPEKVEDFYTRNERAMPLTKEQEDAKKKADDEKKKAEKKKADDAKKKKKTIAELFMESRAAKGPENSKALKSLNEEVHKYTAEWVDKDETSNFDQRAVKDIISQEVMPEIQEKIKEEVNEMIKAELQNLCLKLSIGRKKKKEKKPKKPKPPKKVKIPGEAMIKGRDPIDLLGDMTKAGVVKVMMPAQVSDFQGPHNLLRTLQEANSEVQPDPSYAQLRQLCTEFIALPLGTGFNIDGANRTFLFYGPQGTGKTMMVRAIATECRALFLDISSYNVADKFPDKKKFLQMLVTTFKIAREFQPSVIYMDEIEHYFPGKKKKKPKKGPAPPVVGKCSKFKKDLMAQVSKHLKPTDRVAVIGCTSRPYLAMTKEVSKFFYKKFYFPYPDYTTRCMIFKSMVEAQGVQLTEAFQLNMFGHMTEGITPGTMKLAIQMVLTKRRKEDLLLRPLTVQEFVSTFSKLYFCSAEEYEQMVEFTQAVTGIKDRLKALEDEKDPKKKTTKKK